MASLKREFSLSGVIITTAAALLAFGAAPVFAQGRPNPSGGGGEHAVSRPSGGDSSSAPAPSSSGGSSSTSSSSAESSVGSGSRGGDHAVSRGGDRGSRSGGARTGAAARGGGSPRSVVLPSGSRSSEPGDRTNPAPGVSGAYARPRGNRPGVGHAVPRDISNIPIPPNWGNDYWNYWYSSYYSPYYRYGYAPCMPYYYGCFYYDPYWWDYYYGYTPGYYGYGGGYTSSDESDYDTGSLKLKVKPRGAQVYVDGYFSGIVDDYDGVLQKLKLPAGPHRVELRAEGFQPATLDVLVVEGETVTYRAELQRK